MTATKSIAAGLSGPLLTILGYFLTKIPGWGMMPMEVQGACVTLVTVAVPALMVYHAPANKQTVEPPTV
jgi:hypothetical protein